VEALNLERIRVMSARRKYPLELMERWARMVLEAREDSGESRGAVARVPGVTTPGPPDHRAGPAKIDRHPQVRNPGLSHYQEFALIEDVCVVVESPSDTLTIHPAHWLDG
jgi:hypothetical protein